MKADDKPSRTHHESGFRHKGNVDRYVRDLYKKGEIDKREKADEAREIAAINAVRLRRCHLPAISANV